MKSPLHPNHILLQNELNKAMNSAIPNKIIKMNSFDIGRNFCLPADRVEVPLFLVSQRKKMYPLLGILGKSHGSVVKLQLPRLHNWPNDLPTPTVTIYPTIAHRFKSFLSANTYKTLPEIVQTYKARIEKLSMLLNLYRSLIVDNITIARDMNGFRIELRYITITFIHSNLSIFLFNFRVFTQTLKQAVQLVEHYHLLDPNILFPIIGISLHSVPFSQIFNLSSHMINILRGEDVYLQRNSIRITAVEQKKITDVMNMLGIYSWKWDALLTGVVVNEWWSNDASPVWIPPSFNMRQFILTKRNHLVCPNHAIHGTLGRRGPQPQTKFHSKGGINQLRLKCTTCGLSITELLCHDMVRQYFERRNYTFDNFPEFYIPSPRQRLEFENIIESIEGPVTHPNIPQTEENLSSDEENPSSDEENLSLDEDIPELTALTYPVFSADEITNIDKDLVKTILEEVKFQTINQNETTFFGWTSRMHSGISEIIGPSKRDVAIFLSQKYGWDFRNQCVLVRSITINEEELELETEIQQVGEDLVNEIQRRVRFRNIKGNMRFKGWSQRMKNGGVGEGVGRNEREMALILAKRFGQEYAKYCITKD
jgi:hypothetical protein